jgi:hypothetical protein
LGEEGETDGEDCEEDYGPLGPAPGFADGDERADYGTLIRVSFESTARRGGWEEKTYPNAGPRNGLRIYSVDGYALLSVL